METRTIHLRPLSRMGEKARTHPETLTGCHPERSEGSQSFEKLRENQRFFASLRMTGFKKGVSGQVLGKLGRVARHCCSPPWVSSISERSSESQRIGGGGSGLKNWPLLRFRRRAKK